MSFDRRAVEDVLIDFLVATFPGMSWHLADQAAQIPPRPYGTVKIIAHNALGTGYVEEIPSGTQITERVVEEFVVNVSIQAYGSRNPAHPGAMDILSTVKTAARRPSTLFGVKGGLRLGFLSAGEVRDLAQVVAANWEERAQLDAVFSVAFESDLDIDTIASVAITGAGSTQEIEEP